MHRRLATSVGLASTLVLTSVPGSSLLSVGRPEGQIPRAGARSELRSTALSEPDSRRPDSRRIVVGVPEPTARIDGAIDLALSTPSEWPERIEPLLTAGEASVPAIRAALERLPGADGAQALVATLGAIGGEGARSELRARLDDPDVRLATEAALGLGYCGSPADRELLVSVAIDALRPVRVRTAALVGALRIRPSADLADLAEGIWLAGTDRRIDLRERFRLPDQSRWAFERALIIEVAQSIAGDVAVGMDPDASWDQLVEQFDRFRRFLEER